MGKRTISALGIRCHTSEVFVSLTAPLIWRKVSGLLCQQ
jgi:hypothetical protein